MQAFKESLQALIQFLTDPIGIIVLIIVGVIIYKVYARKQELDEEPPSITMIGDSIVAGFGLEQDMTMYLQEKRPRWLVIDRGVIGLSIKSLANGYKEPFKDAPPEYYPLGSQPPFSDVKITTKYVLVQLGGNDAIELLDPLLYKAYLDDVVGHIIAQGAIPIYTGIVDFTPTGGVITQKAKEHRAVLNDVMLRHSLKHKAIFLDWGNLTNNNEDTIDGIHRTQEANNYLARTIIEAIENKK